MKKYKSNISELSLKRNESNYKKVKIGSSDDAADYVRQFYHDDITIYESVFMLLLNRANNTIGYVKISQGGITGSVVDPKLILKFTIDALASGVILVHNHPSGNLQPSEGDKEVTHRVKTLLNLCDTKLLDHVILTEKSYFSFADNGILN